MLAGQLAAVVDGVERPLQAMASALTRYGDVFRLAVGPRPLWPAVHIAVRLLALADRRA